MIHWEREGDEIRSGLHLAWFRGPRFRLCWGRAPRRWQFYLRLSLFARPFIVQAFLLRERTHTTLFDWLLRLSR